MEKTKRGEAKLEAVPAVQAQRDDNVEQVLSRLLMSVRAIEAMAEGMYSGVDWPCGPLDREVVKSMLHVLEGTAISAREQAEEELEVLRAPTVRAPSA